MTDVVIRQASHEDLDTLLQLRMEVLHNSGQLNYGDSEELEEASWHYYQSALTDGSHIACIATGDGRVFAFDNPRRRYPEIKDDVWELIIRSRLRDGMTRDECRLALGAPCKIKPTTLLSQRINKINLEYFLKVLIYCA